MAGDVLTTATAGAEELPGSRTRRSLPARLPDETDQATATAPELHARSARARRRRQRPARQRPQRQAKTAPAGAAVGAPRQASASAAAWRGSEPSGGPV